MKLQNCITHWEQCIAQKSYFTNEEPKGSQTPVPEDSADENHMHEEFTTQMVIRIFWGTIKMCKNLSASLDLLTHSLKRLAQEHVLCVSNSCSVILTTHQLGNSMI